MHAGKEWSLDSDYGTAPAETGSAYLAMLSIDSLLNVVAALEKLTDIAVEGVVVTPDASAGTELAPSQCLDWLMHTCIRLPCCVCLNCLRTSMNLHYMCICEVICQFSYTCQVQCVC